ncbi:hypothetical protein Vadar_006514 [Vaccinium darrowii]|uniref:Uncharacterized protein n=1 Tax=Vaccinium darrowii TaxID=229202 RepID=A0ACB7X815_9ERIC|nr:hypothetical protein Vadar_006514 [Vaccinium darrowii]
MDEEVLKKLASFVLSKEEEEEVVLSAEDVQISKKECQLSVMGKLITYKGVHLGGLKAAMEIAWGFPKSFRVLEVGGGIYQFIFGNEMDVLRVINGGPWLHNNQLLILHRWREGVNPRKIDFSYSPFWIQLRALPLECMSVEVGRKIMQGFGEIQEMVIAQLNSNQGRCIRVKILIDITKPLPRGKKAKMAGGESFWVAFRYEKLPTLCYYCGVVGHEEKMCIEKCNDFGAGVFRDNQYGAWLKASPIKPQGRRRSEGSSEFCSTEESFSDGVGKGKSVNSGTDLQDPGDNGIIDVEGKRNGRDSFQNSNGAKFGSRSYFGDLSKEGFGQKIQPTKVLAGPRRQLNMALEAKGVGHLAGSLESPVDVRPIVVRNASNEDLEVQKTRALLNGTTPPIVKPASNFIPLSEEEQKELARKEQLDEVFSEERGDRPMLNAVARWEAEKIHKQNQTDGGQESGEVMMEENQKMKGRGSRIILRKCSNSKAGSESTSETGKGKPQKRKKDSDLVEADLDTVGAQSLGKKQKVDALEGIANNSDTVEVASREWPHGVQ